MREREDFLKVFQYLKNKNYLQYVKATQEPDFQYLKNKNYLQYVTKPNQT